VTEFSKALQKKFAKLEAYDYQLIPSTDPGWSYCTGRKLFIEPAKDCKNCHWYECPFHPDHNKWPIVKRILAKCWTFNPALSEPGTRDKNAKRPWDGERNHCARYNALQGKRHNKRPDLYDVDPCKQCSLPVPCRYRGEDGEWLLQQAKTRIKTKPLCRDPAMRGITSVRSRFKVRISVNQKTVNVGTYGSLEEAVKARDAAILKSYRPTVE